MRKAKGESIAMKGGREAAKLGDVKVQDILEQCADKIHDVASKQTVSGMNSKFCIFGEYVIECSCSIWPRSKMQNAFAQAAY